MKPIRGTSAIGRKYGMRPSPAVHRLAHAARLAPQVGELPPSADLSKWHPGIRDQGQEGACTGFATAALREILHGSATGAVIDHRLSPAYLYARTRIAEGSFPEDAGATMADELGVLEGFGVCPEEDLPYRADPMDGPTPICDVAAVQYRVGAPLRVDTTSPAPIKAVLASGLPVGIAIPVYASFEQPGPHGKLRLPDVSREALLGGHGLCVVGYDDARGAWKIANSWGPDWGDFGFCYAPYGYEQLFWEAWTAQRVA